MVGRGGIYGAMHGDGQTVDCAAVNSDRELWREREGDYYADSIHVTEGGGIGMDCGGCVIVMPIRNWHAIAKAHLETLKLHPHTEKVGRGGDAHVADHERAGQFAIRPKSN